MIPRQYKVLLLWLQFSTIVLSGVKGEDVENYSPEGFEGRLLNPKLDRNGWKPLGQGDPLKNDPTFDYSPPALERVRYWAENNKTKEDSGKRSKSDILLLGVPSKRENMKKEQKYTSIRRSYYGGGSGSGAGGNLPTRLMPPPMQTLQPHRMKTTTTEMHHYQTKYPSTKSYFSSSGSGGYRTKSPYDTKYAESNNYVSFTRPDTKYANIRLGPNDFVGMQSHRKPWVHELLQKELIKPKPSPAKPIQTTSVRSVFETHPPSVFITTTSTPIYNPPTTMPFVPTTTTSQKPVYPSYMAPTAYDAFYPTVGPIIDITTEAPLPSKQPLNGHFEVSMYQIIEGHSKVKTYGKSDNDSSTHEAKIVPITPRQEAVVRHVTSSDDLRFTHQVKHLHTKKSTTTTTTTSTTTTTTTPKPYTHQKMSKDETTLSTQHPAPAPAPAQKKAPMQGLLSLLDSSFGNFFIDEPTGDEMGTLFSGPALDTEPTIYVTSTTSYPPTAIELGSPRSSRQIFDYDQLPESRLKELDESEMDEDSDVLLKAWLRSSGADVTAEDEEVEQR